MRFIISKVTELPGIARELILFAGDHRVFLFYGDMGAGKTTFIKALCAEMGVQDTVSSPTFSIVNEYLYPEGSIYHFDFYRLKSESEAFDLGYEDYLFSGQYCLIEWPDKISGLIPRKVVKITLQLLENEKRSIAAEIQD